MRNFIIGLERWAIAGILLALFGFGAGCGTRVPPPPPDTERVWVPLSTTPLRGPATAKVTLVVFSDFQSPFCAREEERVIQVAREYGDTVRIQFRNRPLPNDPDAQGAAEAAAAAAEQGRFWQYHDVLFAHQDALDRASLERYAQYIGLDMDAFHESLASDRARQRVDEDSILAAQLGARGAPVVFVNGRPLRGLTDVATLRKTIDEDVAEADRLLASGVDRMDLYKRIARPPAHGEPLGRPLESDTAPGPPVRGALDPDTIYKVGVGGAPVRGPEDAKVTIVFWSDFECGRCLESEAMLDDVAAAHPRDVRIVWKDRPVPDHPVALLAAEAGLAAAAQGRFWPMHDLLFAEPILERPSLENRADRLGLDMTRFRAALDERTYAGQVANDLDLADGLQIENLPMLFINGRRLPRESLSVETLRAQVEAGLRDADSKLKQGAPREGLYEALIAGGLEAVPGPSLSELPPIPRGTYPVDVSQSPSRGSERAPVTIVTFSDFACPYCVRLEKTLTRLRTEYGGQLRIVWKDAPSPEHLDAMGAHEAARAAAEQGHFWEMHDAIFGHPYLLKRDAYERYALAMGLDMSRFREALDHGKHREAIREETAYAISLAGPSGTPTAIVNGRLLPGAYPIEAFRQVIDEELARAAGERPALRGEQEDQP